MPVKMLVLDEAIQDIQEAVRYYNRKQEGLGRKFEQRVRDALEKIRVAPQAASYAYDTVRYKVLEKFPFIILYEETFTAIIILRVFNTHQDNRSNPL